MNTDKGLVYFNFGSGCGLRLLVSAYTLRKVYSGNAALLLNRTDENNSKLEDFANKMNLQVVHYDIQRICDRNLKSVMAPKILKLSPYEASIQIDADTSFLSDPSFLLEKCYEYGVLVTHFNGWVSDGKIMSKRINGFSDLISSEDLQESLNNRPAVNCGVVGYRKGIGDSFQEEWDDLTNRAAGRFIAEEIACQCVYWKYKNYIATPEWNSSVVWGKLEKSKILHYHGHKHTGLDRRNSRYWWAELGWGIEDGAYSFEDVLFWSQFDKNAKSVLKDHGKSHIEDAKKEFYSVRNKCISSS